MKREPSSRHFRKRIALLVTLLVVDFGLVGGCPFSGLLGKGCTGKGDQTGATGTTSTGDPAATSQLPAPQVPEGSDTLNGQVIGDVPDVGTTQGSAGGIGAPVPGGGAPVPGGDPIQPAQLRPPIPVNTARTGAPSGTGGSRPGRIPVSGGSQTGPNYLKGRVVQNAYPSGGGGGRPAVPVARPAAHRGGEGNSLMGSMGTAAVGSAGTELMKVAGERMKGPIATAVGSGAFRKIAPVGIAAGAEALQNVMTGQPIDAKKLGFKTGAGLLVAPGVDMLSAMTGPAAPATATVLSGAVDFLAGGYYDFLDKWNSGKYVHNVIPFLPGGPPRRR